MNFRVFPILLTFFLMGLADAMGPLSDGVKDNYELSNATSTLLTFGVFIAFAVFSVPGGLLAARIGKKNLLLLGLGINGAALILPSIFAPPFALLLGCIFMLGVGTTFLQVAGNPIMRDVSAEGHYSRNLALAQGFKGVGSTASTYIVTAIATLALFKTMGWRGAFPLFCVLMFVAFFLVLFVKVKETKADVPPSVASSLSLLKEPIFLFAVLGIFLYVGAEASMGRFLSPALQNFGLDKEKASAYGPTLFFLMLTIGRLLGGAILNVMSARTCFRLSALLGLIGSGVIMLGAGSTVTIIGIVAAGFGFANIWPMLFSITVEERPKRANELSGLMCMAISGGAIVPLIMGRLADFLEKPEANADVSSQLADAVSQAEVAAKVNPIAFVVPVICFGYLLVLSLKGSRKAAAA